MSAEAPAPINAPRRRWWLHGLLAMVVLAGLLVLGIAWLIATSGGTRLVLDRAASFVGQGAKLGGVEGSLSGRLRIKSIDIARPDLVVHIADLEIERDPDSSWFGRVVFRKLTAARVEVRTASSGATARVPLAFKAPYALRVEEARVGELRIGAIAKDSKTAPDLVFNDLVVKGEGDEGSWKVDAGSAKTPWGAVSLAGTLATVAPFALDLRGQMTGESGERRYRIAGALAGTLTRIEAKFDAEESELRATGTAIMEPFEAQALRAMTLHMRDVDVARYAGFAHTRLAIDATLEADGNRIKGPVRVTNADPGPLDRERLPIVSAEGQVMYMRDDAKRPRLEVADARFALAGGGSAHGSVRWHQGTRGEAIIEMQSRVADADLARWHSRLRATRLGGTISVVAERDAQRFQLALTDPRFAIEGAATLKDARLEVETVRVKHAGGVLDAKGSIATAGKRDFRFEGRAAHFDPSAFIDRLPGDLNFTFVASGALEPSIAGDLKLDIAQSRLANQPASGSVQVSGDARRVASSDIHVVLGESQLDAKGSFGRLGDALQFSLRAPDLAVPARILGIAAAGKLDAEGSLTGTFAAPGGRVTASGTNLSVPAGLHMASVAVRADIAPESDGKVDAAIEAQGLTRRSGEVATPLAQRATLTVQGTRAAHRASLAATLSKDTELRAALRGGLEPRASRPTWRGELVSLGLTGPSEFNLVAPATLTAAIDRIELGDATLRGAWGEARFATTRWTPALLELRGTSPGIAVRNAARALRLETLPRGSLVVAADWDLRAAETVDGTVSITRASGDLRIGDPPQPLGLEELRLRVDANRGMAKASVSLRGQRIGRLTGEGQATLQHIRAGFGLVPTAPVEGRIDAEMDSIAWIAAWMGPEARTEGRMSAHLVFSGTASDPRWSGRVDAENVKVREPQSGFEVENGVASLALRDRAIVVEKLTATTPWHPSEQATRALQGVAKPEPGTLSAQGSIDLGSRTGTIVIKAVSVPVTQLPMRFLALSGEAKLEARSDGVLATGAFKADAGWIGALATPLPSVSDDVVVVRASTGGDERRTRERLRMDVRFALGDHVWFHGRGLDTRLGGELRVVGEVGGGLRGTGSIRTVDGTYEAYGQKLTIDHGSLTFYGSLENPALNVLALRRGLPVEAGVEVLGNVAHPRARLVSVPNVPDPEKISWLVLGRGPGDVSQGEAATLVAAANAILGRSASGNQIARRFGFDEVRVGRADTVSALGTLPQSTVAGKTGSASAAEVVTVGKRLSKDIYVVYEQGLADAEGALRITWQITQKFQMLLRAGYQPGVDAVYRWTFE